MYRWIKVGVVLLGVLFFKSTAFATFTDKVFGEIVQGALREGGKLTHFEMTKLKDFKAITGVSSPKTNVRVVKVVGYYSVGSNTSVRTLTVPLIIANNGSQIVATAELVPVEEDIYADVLNKNYNRKAFEWFKKEYKGVDLQLKNKKGMVYFEGFYNYTNKSKKDATKAVAGMIKYTRGFIHNLVTARNDVSEKRSEKLGDIKISGPISAKDFERLTEDDTLQGYRKEQDGYTTWSFGNDERKLWFDIENHSDKLVVYISRDVSNLNDNNKQKKFEKLKKAVEKKPFKLASKSEVIYYDEDKNWLSVEMTFLYDGSIKGKKLGEAYWDLWNDYSKKIAAALK